MNVRSWYCYLNLLSWLMVIPMVSGQPISDVVVAFPSPNAVYNRGDATDVFCAITVAGTQPLGAMEVWVDFRGQKFPTNESSRNDVPITTTPGIGPPDEADMSGMSGGTPALTEEEYITTQDSVLSTTKMEEEHEYTTQDSVLIATKMVEEDEVSTYSGEELEEEDEVSTYSGEESSKTTLSTTPQTKYYKTINKISGIDSTFVRQPLHCVAKLGNQTYYGKSTFGEVIREPTTVNITGNYVGIKEKETLRLHCQTDGYEPDIDYDYKWHVKPFRFGNDVERDGQDFVWGNFYYSDEGVYTCYVTYDNASVTLAASVTVALVYKPHDVRIEGHFIDLRENDTLRLECSAVGGQPRVFAYYWTFFPRYDGAENRTLWGEVVEVEEVRYTDSGVYTCYATNQAGMAYRQQLVYVNPAPDELQFEENGNLLMWDELPEFYDLLIISQCFRLPDHVMHEEEFCMNYTLPYGVSQATVTAVPGTNYTYTLHFYRERHLVATSRVFRHTPDGTVDRVDRREAVKVDTGVGFGIVFGGLLIIGITAGCVYKKFHKPSGPTELDKHMDAAAEGDTSVTSSQTHHSVFDSIHFT